MGCACVVFLPVASRCVVLWSAGGDPKGGYHDLLLYDRQLTEKEMQDYELDYIQSEVR